MKLEYSIDNNIGKITLNHPPYNTLVDPVFENPDRLSEFLENPELKAVVITGKGKHFCTGADLNSLAVQLNDPKALQDRMDEGKQLLNIISFATVPVAAAIRGSCMGAGFEIALACHFRFASENSLFGFPETDHGLIPGFSGTMATLDAISRETLISLILSGRMIGAAEAKNAGIIEEVLPTGELLAKTAAFLESMVADRPQYQIRAVLESIHNSKKFSRDEALKKETALFLEVAKKYFKLNRK